MADPPRVYENVTIRIAKPGMMRPKQMNRGSIRVTPGKIEIVMEKETINIKPSELMVPKIAQTGRRFSLDFIQSGHNKYGFIILDLGESASKDEVRKMYEVVMHAWTPIKQNLLYDEIAAPIHTVPPRYDPPIRNTRKEVGESVIVKLKKRDNVRAGVGQAATLIVTPGKIEIRMAAETIHINISELIHPPMAPQIGEVISLDFNKTDDAKYSFITFGAFQTLEELRILHRVVMRAWSKPNCDNVDAVAVFHEHHSNPPSNDDPFFRFHADLLDPPRPYKTASTYEGTEGSSPGIRYYLSDSPNMSEEEDEAARSPLLKETLANLGSDTREKKGDQAGAPSSSNQRRAHVLNESMKAMFEEYEIKEKYSNGAADRLRNRSLQSRQNASVTARWRLFSPPSKKKEEYVEYGGGQSSSASTFNGISGRRPMNVFMHDDDDDDGSDDHSESLEKEGREKQGCMIYRRKRNAERKKELEEKKREGLTPTSNTPKSHTVDSPYLSYSSTERPKRSIKELMKILHEKYGGDDSAHPVENDLKRKREKKEGEEKEDEERYQSKERKISNESAGSSSVEIGGVNKKGISPDDSKRQTEESFKRMADQVNTMPESDRSQFVSFLESMIKGAVDQKIGENGQNGKSI